MKYMVIVFKRAEKSRKMIIHIMEKSKDSWKTSK